MGTVTVGCKVPNGLKIAARNKEAVIAGPRPALVGQPQPIRPGGYEFTDGVDAELWHAWAEAHADAEVVVRRLIFAADNREAAKGLAYQYGRNNPGGFAPAPRSA